MKYLALTILMFSCCSLAEARDEVIKKVSPRMMDDVRVAMSTYMSCVAGKSLADNLPATGNICGVPGYAQLEIDEALKCPKRKDYTPDFIVKDGFQRRMYYYYCDNSEINEIMLRNVAGKWVFFGAGKLAR